MERGFYSKRPVRVSQLLCLVTADDLGQQMSIELECRIDHHQQ